LLIYLLLIYWGWNESSELRQYTHITSFFIWVVWWPGLILLALFASRLWCTVCPLRLIARMAGKLTLGLKVPRWVSQNRIAILTGLFFLHTIIVFYGINHTPQLTSIYLLMLLGYAVIIVLLFEKNTFCNHFCPLNGFIGPYSRISATELLSADHNVCTKCSSNSCYAHCPAKLHMKDLPENEKCLLCFECVKHCPGQNIIFRTRKPVAGLSNPPATIPGMFIIIILLGIMIDEVGEEWEALSYFNHILPDYLKTVGLPETLLGYKWIDALWINLSLPLLLFIGMALLAGLITRRNEFLNFARTYAWAFLPLIFVLHLSKMIVKLNSHIGYLPYLSKNPYEISSFASFGLSSAPGNLVFSNTAMGIFILLILCLGIGLSLVVNYKLAGKFGNDRLRKKSAHAFATGILFTGIIFLITVIQWFQIF
jgi:hypothetical protein